MELRRDNGKHQSGFALTHIAEIKVRAIFSGDSSKTNLLGAADELAELEAQSRSQSIRDFNPHAHLAQFN
jgi:hypothetical protein